MEWRESGRWGSTLRALVKGKARRDVVYGNFGKCEDGRD